MLIPTLLRAAALASLLVLSASAAWVAPRAAAPSQAQSDADRPVLAIEFRALDSGGAPVLDLAPGDLTLKVNGRTRELRSLDLVPSAGHPLDAANRPPSAARIADQRPFDREVLFVVEDESIAPGREDPVRDAVREIVNALPQGDRVGLLSVPLGGPGATFSKDVAGIQGALTRLMGRARAAESVSDSECRTRLTLGALRSVFERVTAGPATTVVLFSGGLTPPALGTDTFAKVGSSSEICPVRVEDYNEVAKLAFRSRANFYVVYLQESLVSGAGRGAMESGLESLAGVAGGELFRLNATNPASLTRVARETAAYYVARSEQHPSDRAGRSYRVSLSTKRKGVRILTRPEITIPR